MQLSNNQKSVVISKKTGTTDYLKVANDDWKYAAHILSHSALLLFLYLASYVDGFNLALSPKHVQDMTGVSRASYHRAFQELVDRGFLKLRDTDERNDYYIFYTKSLSQVSQIETVRSKKNRSQVSQIETLNPSEVSQIETPNSKRVSQIETLKTPQVSQIETKVSQTETGVSQIETEVSQNETLVSQIEYTIIRDNNKKNKINKNEIMVETQNVSPLSQNETLRSGLRSQIETGVANAPSVAEAPGVSQIETVGSESQIETLQRVSQNETLQFNRLSQNETVKKSETKKDNKREKGNKSEESQDRDSFNKNEVSNESKVLNDDEIFFNKIVSVNPGLKKAIKYFREEDIKLKEFVKYIKESPEFKPDKNYKIRNSNDYKMFYSVIRNEFYVEEYFDGEEKKERRVYLLDNDWMYERYLKDER